MSSRNLLLTLLLIGCRVPLTAQQYGDPESAWKIGIAEFSGDKLSRENGYLLSSLPLQLLDVLDDITTHILDETERESRRSMIRSELIRSKRQELSTLYRSYDRLYLTEGTNSPKRTTTNSSILEMNEQLEQLESIDRDLLLVPDSKPIEFVEGSSGRLLPAVSTSAQRAAEIHKIDALLYGRIEQISEYLFVEVTLFTAATQLSTVFSAAGSRETIRSRIEELSREIFSRISGASWGTLDIRSAEETSQMRLNGEFLGIGSRTLNHIPAGSYRLEVSTESFETSEYKVHIVGGETTRVDALPGRKRSEVVTISSSPDSASVYLGSVLRGVTPLSVVPPIDPSQIRVELKGYGAHQSLLVPGGSGTLSFSLISDSIDESFIVNSRREAFYRSLGWFAVAVPVPMLLLDLTNQLTGTANRETTGEFRDTLVEQRAIAYSGYIGGMFLAGVLFVNLVVDLLEYVDLVGLRTG